MLAAQTDTAPVLIHGASGTGKGAIARWLHSNGPRSARPLFQATRARPLSEQIIAAQGSSLLIPEIGEWPLGEQRVLLNFLKSKTVSITPPAAGNAEAPLVLRTLANVRIIATTSQTLEGRAQGGLFNSELLERLSSFRLEMPALGERTEEFEDIVMGIVGEITRELHREHLRSLGAEAWNRLKSYEWPGNLRELRNVLRLAVLAAKGDRIEAENLPEFGHDRVDFRATREEFEKIYLLELLKTFDFQVEKACRITRMDQHTLLQKIDKYGIELSP